MLCQENHPVLYWLADVREDSWRYQLVNKVWKDKTSPVLFDFYCGQMPSAILVIVAVIVFKITGKTLWFISQLLKEAADRATDVIGEARSYEMNLIQA